MTDKINVSPNSGSGYADFMSFLGKANNEYNSKDDVDNDSTETTMLEGVHENSNGSIDNLKVTYEAIQKWYRQNPQYMLNYGLFPETYEEYCIWDFKKEIEELFNSVKPSRFNYKKKRKGLL